MEINRPIIVIMKYLLLTYTLLNSVLSFAQNNFEFTDTLEIYENKVLISFNSYHNSTLSKKGRAFVYEDTLKSGNRKFLRRIFKERGTPALRVEYHGTITQYLENGKYKIGEYENGVANDVKYYDAEGIATSKTNYYELNIKSHLSPENGIFYIIEGTRKRK